MVESLNSFNMGTTIVELQGVVAGLVGVVKDLTTNVAASIFSSRYCGPGRYFRIPRAIHSANIASFRQTSLSLLEQQCVGDEGKAAEEKLKICIAEYGESKEDKCRQLAAKLSAIQQERGESLEQFSFKYKKLLHQLEKLGEKVAKDCPTFVISQFISKVSPSIAQQLIVKASEFEMLDKTIEAARRVELSFQTLPTSTNASMLLDEWKVTLNAFVSSTAVVKPQLPNQHPQ